MKDEEIHALAARYVFRRRQQAVAFKAMRAARMARVSGDWSALAANLRTAMAASTSIARAAGVFQPDAQEASTELMTELTRIVELTRARQEATECDDLPSARRN